jgi:endonuclease YncB( thermonuclease family)
MKGNRQISFLILVFLWGFPTALALTKGDAQNPLSKDKIELSTFRYQDQCGNPIYESMLWSIVMGTVVEVIDGSTMTVRLGDKSERRLHLVAVAAPQIEDKFWNAARAKLTSLALNQTVSILVNTSKDKDKELWGVVQVKAQDINEVMLEEGLGRFRKPEAYAISSYTACVYRLVEGEAQKAKRGLWQR